MIKEVTISRVHHSKNSRVKNPKTLFYRVNYKSEQADTTGLGGTWQGSGVLLDVHLVDDHFVGMAWITNPVIIVKNNLQDLIERIRSYSNCDNVKFIESEVVNG